MDGQAQRMYLNLSIQEIASEHIDRVKRLAYLLFEDVHDSFGFFREQYLRLLLINLPLRSHSLPKFSINTHQLRIRHSSNLQSLLAHC